MIPAFSVSKVSETTKSSSISAAAKLSGETSLPQASERDVAISLIASG
jgi:hypothetical protein